LSDVSVPTTVPPPRRRARRRWPWLALAAGLAVVGGFLAWEGWAAWEGRAARRAADEEHLDEAQQHIDRALRARPKSAAELLLAARIARRRGAYAQAEQYLTRCAEANGMSGPLQLEWQLLRCQRGDVDELAPSLWALVRAGHAESAAILEALASVYMRTTRYTEALTCLNKWVEVAPDSARALDWLGWVSNQLDHRPQAIADYQRALELQPGRSGVRQRLAELLVESSRQAEATPHLEQLRKEQPDNPDVLVLLARCRLVQAQPDEARALLDRVLAEHPNHFDALLRRGEVEYSERHFAAAEKWQRKALEQKPSDPEARYALYLSLQGQDGAQKQAQAKEEFARWRQDRQDRDKLVRLLRTELDRDPTNPDLVCEAGVLLLKQGEDQRGLFWLRRALSLNPRHAPALRALAEYYERTHNPEKAAEYRQQLAALGEKK
jgi:tetratricopeptide (TPR) repeat protein